MHLILASASPRRRELMRLITEEFKVITADIDERELESSLGDIPAKDVSERIARAKAEAVWSTLSPSDTEDAVVVAADTSVISGDRIMGKPKDRAEAGQMLTELSGKIHSVVTGVWIIKDNKGKGFSEETFVEFCPLDRFQRETIESYISTSDPYDKAGGYGIQNGGALLVKRVNGDYFNVVGLPVMALSRELAALEDDNRCEA